MARGTTQANNSAANPSECDGPGSLALALLLRRLHQSRYGRAASAPASGS